MLQNVIKRFTSCLNSPKAEQLVPAIHLAAFGKHPGWNDHVDDIGLNTELLISVKRWLYIEGIGRNIDAGVWDKFGKDQQAVDFDHIFIWCFPKDIVLGKFWASKDGKGRGSYPMVVSAHCNLLPMEWLAKTVFPEMDKIEQYCKATSSAEEVKQIIKDAQNKMDMLVAQQDFHEENRIVFPDTLEKISKWPQWENNSLGLYRILYQFEREIGRFETHKKFSAKKKNPDADLSSKVFRVPFLSENKLEQFLLWESFISLEYGDDIPALYVAPRQKSWLDIILRNPGAEQFYCLKTPCQAMPVISDIPYNLGEEFLERTRILFGQILKKS
jgi:hypothetical protein